MPHIYIQHLDIQNHLITNNYHAINTPNTLIMVTHTYHMCSTVNFLTF